MILKTRLLAALMLLAGSMTTNAATMEITASFSPSMENPENNTFTNTTKQSGYCVSWPEQCRNGLFSISMGGITASLSTEGIKADAPPRESMYFKMPGAWRELTVTDTQGNQATIEFRVSAFSSRFHMKNGYDVLSSWRGKHFVYAPSPCTGAPIGSYTSTAFLFMWRWPVNDAACFKIANTDLIGDPHLINTMSFGYELKTPNPLRMASGLYKGSMEFSVGPGGDFDFGDSYTPSDNTLTLNFTLDVTHELVLSATDADQNVTLQPCKAGNVCTQDEGKANWERWMITRLTPQLTGRSNFLLSSSGAFAVYLECEQQIGPDCALKSDSTPQQVPVKTLLTLPKNVTDYSGVPVTQRMLTAGKDSTPDNQFETQLFGENRRGYIDFLVTQRDVDTMLKTRPDTFRGAVTVIFDPQIN